ncbi:MAG TPA: hypothetical protein VHQ02_04415 [Usitatibacter sp.]|nr:hypothetical protein [Usitatibacter sp.]
MAPPGRRRGAILLLACFIVLAAIGALLAAGSTFRASAARERITEAALAQAREALIAYAADRPITSIVGAGYLPCPDVDGDGWAESTCGSLDGALGQADRLGRLPWKTLGLADLRDGYGERLWYAVSTKYKGLLNCGPSHGCIDMTPPSALGTITVRDISGRMVHDGTLALAARAEEGGVAAIVIAPGPPLSRLEAGGSRSVQRRDCAPGDCDAEGTCITQPPQRAAPCAPANYLDRAPGGEDNADFVDRSDAASRAANGNGFIQGPVVLADGSAAVNDRVASITYTDIMSALMRRVALEVVNCLRGYATRPENGGRYPWAAASCRDGAAAGNAADVAGALYGSVADTPFARTSASSGGRMLERWWRTTARTPERLDELPTKADACRIAVPPDDAAPPRTLPPGSPASEGEAAGTVGNAWWTAWLPFVSYALAPPFAPGASPPAGCAGGACLAIDDAAGHAIARDKEIAVFVSPDCASAPRCDAALGCAHLVVDTPSGLPHALATYP